MWEPYYLVVVETQFHTLMNKIVQGQLSCLNNTEYISKAVEGHYAS